MIFKSCIVLGALLLADVPWWDDTSHSDAPIVTDTVKMPLQGGLSPDGKYQIFVIGNDPLAEDYAFGFYGGVDGKSLLFQMDLNGAFCVVRGASEIDRALWNDDDSLVAIEDHDTRHSMALHIISIKDGKGYRVTIPPFGKAITEKMANVRGGAANACGCKPLKWNGRELTFEFYAASYTSTVKMKVPRSNASRAVLVSESAPEQVGDTN
jgi:hypothetical protein